MRGRGRGKSMMVCGGVSSSALLPMVLVCMCV